MKSRPYDSDFLQDMLDACLKVTTFTKGMTFEEFEKDEKTQYAVIRALEVIGDLRKKSRKRLKNETQKFLREQFLECGTK